MGIYMALLWTIRDLEISWRPNCRASWHVIGVTLKGNEKASKRRCASEGQFSYSEFIMNVIRHKLSNWITAINKNILGKRQMPEVIYYDMYLNKIHFLEYYWNSVVCWNFKRNCFVCFFKARDRCMCHHGVICYWYDSPMHDRE